MKYRHFIIKRMIEDVMIFPFIVLGRLIAMMKPSEKEYAVYFFFPFYHVGGAEKVHAQVAKALGNANCIIYFTRKSANDLFYQQFADSGCVMKDISKFTDNKFIYFVNLVYRGIITYRINRQRKKPLVFNGQCNFGYKISPWVKRYIPQVELIHSYNTFSWIRLPFLPFIHQTVMIAKVRIEDHIRQYRKLNVPAKYDQRIRYICNGIPINGHPPAKETGTFRVLYMGRATVEKRVHLIAKMAQMLGQKDNTIEFVFVGDAEQAVPQELRSWCTFYPYESDEKKITELYDQAHILIIVSDTEGFPMVIEEAMARGCIILATPVGDIPVHIKNGLHGYLFTTVSNEEQIVREGVKYIEQLKADSALRQKMAENNFQYALQHFSLEIFNDHYKALIHSLKNPA